MTKRQLTKNTKMLSCLDGTSSPLEGGEDLHDGCGVACLVGMADAMLHTNQNDGAVLVSLRRARLTPADNVDGVAQPLPLMKVLMSVVNGTAREGEEFSSDGKDTVTFQEGEDTATFTVHGVMANVLQ